MSLDNHLSVCYPIWCFTEEGIDAFSTFPKVSFQQILVVIVWEGTILNSVLTDSHEKKTDGSFCYDLDL